MKSDYSFVGESLNKTKKGNSIEARDNQLFIFPEVILLKDVVLEDYKFPPPSPSSTKGKRTFSCPLLNGTFPI